MHSVNYRADKFTSTHIFWHTLFFSLQAAIVVQLGLIILNSVKEMEGSVLASQM